MSDLFFNREIYKGRNFRLKFMCAMPTVAQSERGTINERFYPVLYLSPNQTGDYDPNRAVNNKGNSFKVNPKNIFRVVRYFNDVLKWFEIKDLFLRLEESNEITFNADYNSLQMIYEADGWESQALKVVPATILVGPDQTKAEGILLYINRTENVFEVSKIELEDLVYTLHNFSFIEELQLELLSYLTAKANNTLISGALPSFGYGGKSPF